MREICLVHLDKTRPALILTRQTARGAMTKVTVAPITTTTKGLSSEVRVGPDNGLDHGPLLSRHLGGRRPEQAGEDAVDDILGQQLGEHLVDARLEGIQGQHLLFLGNLLTLDELNRDQPQDSRLLGHHVVSISLSLVGSIVRSGQCSSATAPAM